MVLNIEVKDEKKIISLINPVDGYIEVEAKSIILAMGCRERTRGAINIPGDRPAGIFTAGAAQKYINIEGHMVGRKIIILGSGDIGLIMARRMSLEGAKVEAVIEVMPFSGGLTRNIVQCLEDFNIPLYLSHTVTKIIGKERIEKVVVSQVDEKRKPIHGTEIEYDVDTLLLSVGLIPENELTRYLCAKIDIRTKGPYVNEMMETTVKGVFACGNVVHVHDLVDFVSEEGERAGRNAAESLLNEMKVELENINIKNGNGIVYTVPQILNIKKMIEKNENIDIFMRVNNVYENMRIVIKNSDKEILGFYRKHLTPGEMQRVTLPSNILKEVKSDITIILQEDKI